MSERELLVDCPAGAIERREFIRRLLLGAIGLPAGAALLAGCDGNGFLDGGGGGGNLAAEVADVRALQTQIITAVRGLQSAGDADIDGWLVQTNAQVAAAWPLMVAAAQPALRDNVAAEMDQVLAQLDGLSEPLVYAGPAPQITRQQFQDAWDRAHDIAGVAPAQDGDTATRMLWVYLFLLFVLFPALGDADALSCASDAVTRDTANRALALWNTFHLTSVSCTPCLFSGLLSMTFGVTLFLYLGMAAQAAGAPGMLFGRDWLIMLTLIAALLLLPFD